MPAAPATAVVRCSTCGKAYRIPSRGEDRNFRCRKCGGEVRYRAGEAEEPAATPAGRRRGKRRRADLSTAQAAVRVAAILSVVAVAAWGLTRGPSTPTDRLFAALDREYLGIIEVVAEIDSPEDAEAVQPDLVARVAEVNALLNDPRPFGAPRPTVAPAVWERHGEALCGRLEYLRRQKSRVFNLSGAGRYLSSSLSQLPQVERLLRERLREPPEPAAATP